MKHTKRPLRINRETVRMLIAPDLGRVAGGHPTGFPTVCTSVAPRRASFTDECPSENLYN